MTAEPTRHHRARAVARYLCSPAIARRVAAYWAVVAPAVILAYLLGQPGG